MPDPRLRLHLDADASRKALHRALLERGHDVSRTPSPWMALDATDSEQLLGAIDQERAIFTFNIRDFAVLTSQFPGHWGIIVASQSRWTLGDLVKALDSLLTATPEDGLRGRFEWLQRPQDQLSARAD